MKFILLMTFLFSFNATNGFSKSTPKLDSASSDLYDLTLEDGLIYSYSNNTQVLKKEISNQLKFLVGYFNNFYSGPDLERLDVTQIKAVGTASGFRVSYKATLTIAWANEIELPSNLMLYLPERGTPDFINRFTAAYAGEKYGDCADEYPEAPTSNNFFYHYRPLNESCKIKERIPGTNDLLVTINTSVVPSLRKTVLKKPEYLNIWKDNELSVFIISGKYEIKGTDESDAGIESFRKVYENLISTFGTPAKTNLANNLAPSADNNFVEIGYILADQKIITIRILLVSQLSTPSIKEINIIQKYTPISDLVIYSGHAGLGVNSDKLVELSRFQKNKYQIYVVDGCDTFSYIGKKLFAKSGAANPGKNGTLFLDTITNAMPSYFTSSPNNNVRLIESLMIASESYQEILLKIDKDQRSVVDGEEDNLN